MIFFFPLTNQYIWGVHSQCFLQVVDLIQFALADVDVRYLKPGWNITKILTEAHWLLKVSLGSMKYLPPTISSMQ